MGTPKVTGVEEIASTRWLKLQTLSYTDPQDRERKWDMATRTTRTPGSVDGVAILALLHSAGNSRQSDEMLLVTQFRPPVNAVTLELPAGLIDAGETPEQAALRELKEETGYVGTVASCSATLAMSPGLTDEAVKLVVVDVDLAAAENKEPTQALDEGEFIGVRRVRVGALGEELRRAEAEGVIPFAGLHLLSVGLSLRC